MIEFSMKHQYGDYVTIRSKRERSRKIKKLRQRMEEFVPEQYWSQVTWIRMDGHPRNHNICRRTSIMAWKVGLIN